MRTSIALLAGLAGSALALPATTSTQLDTRTFGLISGIIHTIENILTGGVSPAHILGGISAEAAAALHGSALGCAAGSVDLAYRKKLAYWLKAGAGVHLEASLRTALLAWCEADASVDLELDLDIRAGLGFFIPTCAKIAAEADLYVTLDGVFELATDALAVLSATAQATLEAAIVLLGEVDWKIKAGLEFCAAGGIVGDLDVEIINALKVWLSSSECTLAVGLKKTLLLWVEGKIGGDVVGIGHLPVGGVATIGVGKSLEALVGVNGALVASAQAQLKAFLQTDVGLEIDVAILNILKICAKGGLAVDVDLDKRVELSLWLASSKCSLSAELKGLLAFWLSFGVSAETDLSLSVHTNIISELTGFLTGTIDALLGTHLHGLLSFILGGEGVLSLSLEARAQLAALIGGGVGIEIDDSIQIILIGWLTGCQKCCGGSQVTHGPSVPSSTPALPASETPSVPAGTPAVPTGAQTPSVPAGTPSAPTDVSPTDIETPASPSETPCETLTSDSVTSYTVSETASVPAGTETPAAPTDVQPTETPAVPTDVQPTETPATPIEAQPSETPCETLTSDSVTSYTVSETASVPAGTETPAAPTDVQPSETPVAPTEAQPSETPCETLTSDSVTSYTVSETASVPAGTETPAAPTDVQPTETPAAPTEAQPSETPCETLTSDSVTSYTVSETASVPAGTETPAAPTDVQPTETPAAPTEAQPSETPCETLTSDSVTSYTVSETASVPAGTETPAAPTDVQPTETPAAPTEAQPSETPCETLTSDSVTSYTVSQTTSVPAAPTDVSPSSSSCAGCGGIKTVTVTKTIGIEACPTDF